MCNAPICCIESASFLKLMQCMTMLNWHLSRCDAPVYRASLCCFDFCTIAHVECTPMAKLTHCMSTISLHCP